MAHTPPNYPDLTADALEVVTQVRQTWPDLDDTARASMLYTCTTDEFGDLCGLAGVDPKVGLVRPVLAMLESSVADPFVGIS